jgi:hypothetical protein
LLNNMETHRHRQRNDMNEDYCASIRFELGKRIKESVGGGIIFDDSTLLTLTTVEDEFFDLGVC